MRKWKTFLAIAVMLAFLLAGAFFPKTISGIYDWKNTGVPASQPLGTIQLELRTNISAMGKLSMMSRMTGSIELAERKAEMTKAEVLDTVHKALQPYIDAKLIADAPGEVQLYPCLVQVEDALELQSILWVVTISGYSPGFSYIDLAVDDETGRILSISYTYEMGDPLSGKEALSAFADIYFTGLGIADYAQFASSDLDYAFEDETSHAMRYRFGDIQYGEINVDLHVHSNGFYVEFPGRGII